MPCHTGKFYRGTCEQFPHTLLSCQNKLVGACQAGIFLPPLDLLTFRNKKTSTNTEKDELTLKLLIFSPSIRVPTLAHLWLIQVKLKWKA